MFFVSINLPCNMFGLCLQRSGRGGQSVIYSLIIIADLASCGVHATLVNCFAYVCVVIK